MDDNKEIELDLSKMNLDELKEDINIDDLEPTEDESTLPSNIILEESQDLTLGLTKEQIEEFYDYLAGRKPRPIFAEKFFADGESRIRESNQLTTMMSLSFVPKLLAMQQSLIESLSTPDSLKYLSADEKISYLNTLAAMSTKFNEIAMKYSQANKDFSSVPLVYRQLLDQLLSLSTDKLPRLKNIPKLVEVSDEIWDRIVEIAKLND